jgi:hypothetical protein
MSGERKPAQRMSSSGSQMREIMEEINDLDSDDQEEGAEDEDEDEDDENNQTQEQ